MMLERIENGLDPGWPDVYYCFCGKDGWIELKAPTEPARASTRLMSGQHELTREQRNWLLKHWQCGGRSWVLIGSDSFNMLIHGSHADKVNRLSANDLALLADECGPANAGADFWKDVFLRLIR